MADTDNRPATGSVKRIGELFVEAKMLSDTDLNKGLEYGKKTGMPLGRVLVMLRMASDADLRAVLYIQSLMKFENMPGHVAVKALQYMKEKSVHIEWACKQVGWQSEKLRNDLPPRLKELKEKLADAEQRLGAEHIEVAEAQLQLAAFYEDEKMWAHAEASCRQAVEKLERLGNDLKLASGLWALANILFAQERFAEAEPLYLRIFEIRAAVLGGDDPQVGGALFDLAEVYDVQKKYADAERAYFQALAVQEKYAEIEDPEIISTLRRLSFVCSRRVGSPDQVLIGQLLTESAMVAEDKIPEALAFGKEKGVPMARALIMLGHLSEDALRPVLHAQVLVKSNLLPGALAARILRLCHKRGISIDEAMARVGWKLRTTRAMNLSELLGTHDRLIDAEKSLPPDDPTIGALCLQLADLYETYERYADAEPLYKRALSIVEKQDEAQAELMVVLDKLAWVYVKQAKHEQAEALYKRVYDLRVEMLGDMHADVATSCMHLGQLYLLKGETDEGIAFCQKALRITEQEYGATHEQVGNILEQMALAYFDHGDYDRAEPMFWQAFKIKKEYQDVRSLEMVSMLSKLAELYNKQNNYTMADSVLNMLREDKALFV